VTCQGTRVALERQTRVVYDVVVEDGPGERRWASRYGFGGAGASERAAAEAALEEMERLHRDPDGWGKDWTGGMSPRAAEAVLEAPRAHEDREAADWIGPQVVQLRAQGLWLEPADVADEGSGAST